MPVYRLPRQPLFPDPEESEPDGLLAVGGDLSVERLLAGYRRGIFPWYSDDSPILWWSPNPRMMLLSDWLHVPHSLSRTIRRGRYTVRADTAFGRVIRHCAETVRPGNPGTWITPDMIHAYEKMHAEGHAHSFEAWEQDVLVGGLYGVSLGGVFFGESMFTSRPDASKVAFVASVKWLAGRGVNLVDCQMHTEHLARFGAREIPRDRFLAMLGEALAKPDLRGKWEMGAESSMEPRPSGRG